ncbi:MAG: HipA domain-containing protein [Deltaproteobacteria bacterium]|nr:HipA domain-containing protein [Deltaproteobacteria bacterium]
MSAALDVYRESTRVGRLERTRHGSVFSYDATFLDAPGDEGIAVHLPKTRERIATVGVNLHTFFAGLLPEGARLRAMVRRLKASEDDLFTLLASSGSDCIGDIAVAKAGEPLPDIVPTVEVDALERVVFADLFARSITQSGREPLIPGVQEKISASMISFPVRGTAAAWILKLEPAEAPKLVENEAYFLEMARKVGIPVPPFQLVHDAKARPGLLVERFDRVVEAGVVRKLHQEDACQLLDRYPADKYQLGSSDLMQALDVCSAPVAEKAKLFRLLVFSYLIGNGDLHAKNASVRTRLDGIVELSPAYDILSTFPYGDRHMALRVDARDDNLRRAQLVKFAARHGLREPAVLSVIDAIVEAAPMIAEGVARIGFEPKKTEALRRLIAKRARDLA